MTDAYTSNDCQLYDGVMAPRKKAPARIPGRAVGYIRVSTVDQAETGHSLDAQRRRIEAYCQARGWELVNVYADEGKSATKRRPAFEQMVADVLADGVSHVVAIKLDRLGRSAKQMLDFYDQLESKGVGIVTIDDGIDTSTAIGRMFRTIVAAFAEFERERISERTRDGLAEARAKGVELGRKSALPDAVRDRIVTERNSGATLAAIARQLNDDGVATGQGGASWYPSTVQAVLRSAKVDATAA